jgi:cell wall-associated NlpC family hydrolase
MSPSTLRVAFAFCLLLVLLQLILTGCSSTSSSMRYSSSGVTKDEMTAHEDEEDFGESKTGIETPVVKSVPKDARTRLQREIDRYMGVRYRYGGSDESGFDCSGYTSRIYNDALSVKLPRSSGDQSKVGASISNSDLRFGDLVFFRINRGRISHVGVYLSDGNFAHASIKRGIVVNNLSEAYYKKYYATAKRIVQF